MGWDEGEAGEVSRREIPSGQLGGVGAIPTSRTFYDKMIFPIYVTKSQHEAIKTKAEILGFISVNAFVRFALLNNIDLGMEKKIKELHKEIMKQNDKEQKNQGKNNSLTISDD